MNDTIALNMLRKYRRDLHRIPELGYQLPKTITYIRKVLESLPGKPPVFSPCESTICCFLNRNKHATVAVRSVMDALPAIESTGYGFASKHKGIMHSCGYDGDMAMTLTLAQYLATHEGDSGENILLIFQPAAETYSGKENSGAEIIKSTTIFKELNVNRIIATRLWHNINAGKIVTKEGALLAASSEIDVMFEGESAHLANEAEGKPSALDLAVKYYNIISHSKNTEHLELTLRFGHMTSGTVRNQIGSRAKLEGTLRAPDVNKREKAIEWLESEEKDGAVFELMKKYQESSSKDKGVRKPVFCFKHKYPPIVNSKDYIAKLKEKFAEKIAIDNELHCKVSDDFSFYQEIPGIEGVYFLLGTGMDSDSEDDYASISVKPYSSNFGFNEEILLTGLELYKSICTTNF